jgi:hypothetical protein
VPELAARSLGARPSAATRVPRQRLDLLEPVGASPFLASRACGANGLVSPGHSVSRPQRGSFTPGSLGGSRFDHVHIKPSR